MATAIEPRGVTWKADTGPYGVDRRLATAVLWIAVATVALLLPRSMATAVQPSVPPARPSVPPAMAHPRVETGMEPPWQRLETSYRLVVRLHVRTGRAAVIETLDVRNPGPEPVDHLDLSILAAATDEFRLESLKLDGRATVATWTNPANLRLILSPALGAIPARIVVRYRLMPSHDVSSSLETRTSFAEGIVRFGGWFPVVSDGHGFRYPGDSQVTAQARSIRLELVTDAPVRVAAPGHREGGGRRVIYELERARDFAFAVSRRYRLVRGAAGGVEVDAFVLPGSSASLAILVATRSLAAFAEAYGPYPYDRLVIAESPRSRLGNEYPGIVFLGADSLHDRVVVTHETAHQWFYGVVGNDQLREPWLDEALAEFIATDAWNAAVAPCEHAPVGSPVTAFPNRRDTLACGGYGDTVYRSGAALVRAVRDALGDERFAAAMREYVDRHRGKIATSADLVDAWVAAADDPIALRAMIERALYGTTPTRAPIPVAVGLREGAI